MSKRKRRLLVLAASTEAAERCGLHRRQQLASLADFEVNPHCPGCGSDQGLTSGLLAGSEAPSVLFCRSCGRPVVGLS